MLKEIFPKVIHYKNKFLENIGSIRREKYLQKKRKQLKNQTISIITNDCVGGIIYSDLGLRFLSPTINLFFSPEDYLEFLNDLEYYINSVPLETTIDNLSYPVGILKKGDKEILIHFMHYESFEAAKNKWIERAKRINYDNLYIIFEYRFGIDADDPCYKKFKALPFQNKRMLTYADKLNDDEFINCRFYRKNYYPGKSLLYPKRYSQKRYLDYFDYVSFFNKSP